MTDRRVAEVVVVESARFNPDPLAMPNSMKPTWRYELWAPGDVLICQGVCDISEAAAHKAARNAADQLGYLT